MPELPELAPGGRQLPEFLLRAWIGTRCDARLRWTILDVAKIVTQPGSLFGLFGSFVKVGYLVVAVRRLIDDISFAHVSARRLR